MKTNKLLTLSLTLLLSLVSCGNKKPSNTSESSSGDSSTEEVLMSESYQKAREEFKIVTGLELPALANLEVDEFPYREGATDYCFDIIGGSALNYQTYQLFESFFIKEIGDCDNGFPDGNEANGRDAQWTTSNNRWYQTFWDAHNTAIYINTMMKEQPVNMTDSYKEGRQAIYDLTGIWIPQLENIDLLPSSDINPQNGVVCFDFISNKDVFTSFYSYIRDAAHQKSNFTSNGEEYNEDEDGGFWIYIESNNGKYKRINIDITFDSQNTAIYLNVVVKDLHIFTLSSTSGGSVSIKMGNTVYTSNTVKAAFGDNLVLSATPDNGHDLEGWYINNSLLSTSNPFTYEMENKNITIQAKFVEMTSNMTPSYKEVRRQLYEISGIVLPELEDVTTSNEYFYKDTPQRIRDEAQCQFIFSSTEGIRKSYQDIKNAVISISSNPTSSKTDESGIDDEWSIPLFDANIPYRIDAMMHYQEGDSSIYFMWRKQPIVTINVKTEGPGKAYFIYSEIVDGTIIEHQATKYWVLVDACFGGLKASPDLGKQFLGWYVDDKLISEDKIHGFNYQNVNFTEITFVAKFGEPTIDMTQSYYAGKSAFTKATGIELPNISNIDADISIGDYGVMFDLVGGSNCNHDTFETLLTLFNNQEGWTCKDDSSMSTYPTFTYTNTDISTSFQIVWNSATENDIYINTTEVGDSFNAYATIVDYFETRFDIDLPNVDVTSSNFYCNSETTEMTFDLTNNLEFNEEDYSQFINALEDKLGDGLDESSDIQKRMTWLVYGLYWDINWDLETSLSINFLKYY